MLGIAFGLAYTGFIFTILPWWCEWHGFVRSCMTWIGGGCMVTALLFASLSCIVIASWYPESRSHRRDHSSSRPQSPLEPRSVPIPASSSPPDPVPSVVRHVPPPPPPAALTISPLPIRVIVDAPPPPPPPPPPLPLIVITTPVSDHGNNSISEPLETTRTRTRTLSSTSPPSNISPLSSSYSSSSYSSSSSSSSSVDTLSLPPRGNRYSIVRPILQPRTFRIPGVANAIPYHERRSWSSRKADDDVDERASAGPRRHRLQRTSTMPLFSAASQPIIEYPQSLDNKSNT